MIDDKPRYRRRSWESESYKGLPHLSRRQEPSAASPAQASPKPPAASTATPSKESKTSSFLSRLARTSLSESGSSKAGWISTSSIDHSSPSANLVSRLNWVETAFKKKEELPAQVVQQIPPQQVTQQTTPEQLTQGVGEKERVGVLRRRVQSIILELQSIDKELCDL